MMTKEEKEYVIDRYNKIYEKQGISDLAVGYDSNGKKRISNMLEMILLEDTDSVLDVGCGFGALYKELKQKEFRGEYIGIDINEKYINDAKKIYPEAFSKLFSLDIYEILREFDWIIAIGIFAHRLTITNNISYIKKTVEKMFSLCIKGVVVSFLTGMYEKKDSIGFGVSVLEAEDIMKQFSDKIKIKRKISSNNEFAIGIYK